MIKTLTNSGSKPVALVIGGAGFIGSFLTEALLLQNCRLIVFDVAGEQSKQNLKRCWDNPDLTFSVTDFKKPLPVLLKQKPDYIFDLTGQLAVNQNSIRLAADSGTKLLLGVYDLSQAKKLQLLLNSFPQTDFRLVFIKDVYGPRMDLEKDLLLPQLLKASLKKGRIKIKAGPNFLLQPTFIADLIYGLTKAMFSSGTEKQLLGLVNPKSITLARAVGLLEELTDKKLQLDYSGASRPSAEVDLNIFSKKINWQPEVELKPGMGTTLDYFSRPRPIKTKKKKPTKKKPSQAIKVLKRVFLGLAALFLLAFFSLAWEVIGGVLCLKSVQRSILKADFAQAHLAASRAEKRFTGAKHQAQFYHLGEKTVKFIGLAENLAKGVGLVGRAGEKGSQLVQVVFQKEEGNPFELIEAIETDLESAYFYFSSLQGELKTPSDPYPLALLFGGQQQIDRLNQSLPQIREMLLQAQKGIEVLPQVIGLNQRQTYLVLLQNNHELRPTGGFIGSFALLTFEQGRLLDFTVEDVYWADGQLKGHVEPPAALKKYLGEAGWYLRDANWDPDFPLSAQKISWFLEKEIDRRVDGVWGINLFLVQDILALTGDLSLPDYPEKINSDNLFERAEYYAEVGFFPGSTQKQDFLGCLARALYEKLINSSDEAFLRLIQALFKSLQSKDLVFYFTDPSVAQTVADLGWDGGIKQIDCLDSESKPGFCLADYLMIVEANVGVNKVNYFIRRDLAHQVWIDPGGGIKETLVLKYENQSPAATFPGGDYKNYLRLLVPQGAILEEITFDQKPIDLEKVDFTVSKGKTVFGFLVEVAMQGKKEVKITYRLAEKLNLAEKNLYLFFLQRQPGTKKENFALRISPPVDRVILSASPQATVEAENYLFNPLFDQDLAFEVFLASY